MNDTMGSRIRALRLSLELSQQGFAELLDVTQPTVHRWERDLFDPDDATIARLAEMAGMSMGAFRYGERANPAGQAEVPVAGYVGAGAEVYSIDDHAKGDGIELVEAPPGESRETIAVIVRGDSMYPVYQDGDVLFYAAHDGVDERACLGRECVVRTVSGQTLVKRVTRGGKAHTYNLLSYNAPPMDGVQLEWAAPVRWVRRN